MEKVVSTAVLSSQVQNINANVFRTYKRPYSSRIPTQSAGWIKRVSQTLRCVISLNSIWL